MTCAFAPPAASHGSGLPFPGGILVPSPDVVVALPTDGSGMAKLTLQWSTTAPAGLSVCYQARS